MQNTHSSSTLASLSALDATRPCIVRAADATVIELPGERSSMKMPSSKTAGLVTLNTLEVAANGGPPPHVHHNEEEIFFIKSGAIELFANSELTQGYAGDVVYLNRGEAHRFRGLDVGDPNIFDILVAPGGFEHFYTRWARLFDNGAPDMQQALPLCGEYGITLYPSDEATPLVAEAKSKIVRSGQRPLQVAGCSVQILLSAADTDGKYSVVRVEGPRGAGPTPHIHENEDELFMVDAGQVEFYLDGETVIAEAGDVVWGPRGFAHTFRLASDDACLTALMTPGGFDQFFTECALNELAGQTDIPTMIAACARHGVTVLPPTQ